MLHDAGFLNLLLLLSASMALIVESVDPTFNDDVLGLIVFKAGLDDPNSRLTSWNEEDNDPCNWVGVRCDLTTNRVTELRLDGFSLSGHIGRGLLRLQSLQTLILSNNNLSGTLNPAFPHMGSLQIVDFSGNNLSGRIPDGFFEQCGSLSSVFFAKNKLSGPIPVSLTYCSTLAHVNFSSNQLSGRLPREIWLLRSLKSVDFSDNFLEGDIPDGISALYDLEEINFSKNWFSGVLPADTGSCSSMKSLDFSENYFSGYLPDSMRKLGSCSSIRLQGNSLAGEIPGWIGEIAILETLDLSANNFSGSVPFSMGNLEFLKELNLSGNMLEGELPETMANCSNLVSIDVSRNAFTGSVPRWMFKTSVEREEASGYRLDERTDNNTLSSVVGVLGGLQVLDLSSNGFTGEIPPNIWIHSSLLRLNMSKNALVGSIPSGIGGLKTAQVVDLSNNWLKGSIPSEIGGAISLKELRLQKNFLSGHIPLQISNCSGLTTINLSQNNLSGPVPASIVNLGNLQYVDLSLNDLSGILPKEVANLSHLFSFNISHNHIEGELPAGGFFNTIPPSSVSGNPSLCGSIVNRPCPSVHPKPIVLNPNSSNPADASATNHRIRKNMLSISALIAIGAAAFIAIGVVAITLLNIHARSAMSRHNAGLTLSNGETFSCSPSKDPEYGKLVMFSGDAEFATTGAHALLNKDCELGRGGFGVVYQTNLRDGHPVAIKKLTVSGLIKSQEEFEREVKKLAKMRHQNLVELKGYYWTPSLQLLIYEFVPSGSLYKSLHGDDNACLSWRQRFGIILGIAKGLAFLHRMNIIHYNLKSTNILLGSSGEPKVSDFGLARLLAVMDRCILSSKIQSALGYMAPEFACQTVKITEKSDIYGFGMLVLEVVTGKRPVEYMEDDVVVLCEMVRGALEDGRVEECVDGKLRGNFPVEEAIPAIKLGLICASQVPSNRPDMEEVVNILELIQCPSEGQEELE